MDLGRTIVRAVAIAAAIGIVGAVLKWVKRRRRDSKQESRIFTYEESKRRIRAGDIESAFSWKLPSKPPPKPLDEVFSIPDDRDFFFALIDRAHAAESVRGWTGLTDAERTLCTVWSLIAEVNNGGFDQYFFNPSGNHARGVPDALREIGATEVGGIFERALTVFGDAGPDPDRESRWEQADAWTDADKSLLGALTSEFYEFDRPLLMLLAAWARTRREQFT